MTNPTTVPLIRASEPVSGGLFAGSKPIAPNLAAVYDDGCGGLEWFRGRPPRRAWGLGSPYRVVHLVDMGDNWRRAELLGSPLIARGDAYQFQTKLTVGFRVVDPVQIVRRNVTDALIVVYDYLLERFRPIARGHEIHDAGVVESRINALFTGGSQVTPEGIEIFHCRAEVEPDAAMRGHAAAVVSAGRRTVQGAAEQIAAEAAARGQAQLDAIAQEARREQEREERATLAGLPLDLPGLVKQHLIKHPEDTGYAMELLARAEESRRTQQDSNDQRMLDLVRFMADRDLIQAADVERLRANVLGHVQEISGSAPSGRVDLGLNEPLPLAAQGRVIQPGVQVADSQTPGWPTQDAPQPADAASALPVYLLFDESYPDPGYLAAVNDGLRRLGAALSSAPEAIAALRLAVLGFAADAVVRMPMTVVASGGYIPPVVARDGAAPDHRRLFQRLAELIPQDVERLKGRELRVSRPTVHLLCAGPGGIGPDGLAAHRDLVDRGSFKYAPNVFVCSMGAADHQAAAGLATNPRLAFQARPGQSAAESADRYMDFLISNLARTAAAHVRGEVDAEIEGPKGFTAHWGPPQQ